MNPEDLEELAEDRFLTALGRMLLAIDNKTSVIDQQRMKEIRFAYYAAKEMLIKEGMKLSYKLNEPLKSMGSVSIEGRELSFDNPEWFARTAEFSNNTEVYPLANGDVRVTFTFHGLTHPIE